METEDEDEEEEEEEEDELKADAVAAKEEQGALVVVDDINPKEDEWYGKRGLEGPGSVLGFS